MLLASLRHRVIKPHACSAKFGVVVDADVESRAAADRKKDLRPICHIEFELHFDPNSFVPLGQGAATVRQVVGT
jgi:hypothetical protein